eukprot:COSAG02_NODE_47728_length_339_cov_0.641667_1_plen_22_part_01
MSGARSKDEEYMAEIEQLAST